MTDAMKYLDKEGNAPFHISFDLDAVDPYQVSQTGTMYRDGLSHR
jgi:arginase family enzyme